jgi:ABC-type branched-subunit amino acid transport system ATPase component
MGALLEIDTLTCRFGGVTAVDGFDLSMAAGEFALRSRQIVLSGPAQLLLHDPKIRHAYLGGCGHHEEGR